MGGLAAALQGAKLRRTDKVGLSLVSWGLLGVMVVVMMVCVCVCVCVCKMLYSESSEC